MFTTIVTPKQLNHTLDSVTVIDCRFDLTRPETGYEAYVEGHIAGAIYAHLDRDLSGPKSDRTGRHPLPSPDALAETFSRWGIDANRQVVAYDADSGMYASRLWWLLRWLGHAAVAVLDGGYKGWLASGFPSSREVPSPERAAFTARIDDGAFITTDEMTRRLGTDDWRVLDARAPERFRGDVEPIDPVAGHIPGARNYPFALNLTTEGRFATPAALKQKLRAALDGVSADRSIMMCGSGVTACHNLLALEVAGLPGAKLYAGSWSEWIRDPSRPIAKG